MSSIRTMWANYCTLFDVLVEWMSALIGPPRAREIARQQLALLARLSWHGYQTAEGPYAELIAVCVAQMAAQGMLAEHGHTVAVIMPKRMPDQEGMGGICALYAASYQACYEGQWSTSERELVYQYMRMNDPAPIPDDWEDPLEAANDTLRPLLRRALYDIENFFTSDKLVSDVSCSIADDELLKSIFWMRQH